MSKVDSSDGSRPTADPKKQQRKKTIVASLVMLVPFCLSMYMIFSGRDKPEVSGQSGINYSVPDGRGGGIEASKQKAVDRLQMEQQQQKRTLSLDDNAFSLMDEPSIEPKRETGSIEKSQQAYHDATRQINGFYNAPRTDREEVEKMKKQVAELTRQLEQQQSVATVPDPMELAEKQYALAAKYFGAPGGNDPPAEKPDRVSEKDKALPVQSKSDDPVSTLAAPLPDSLLRRELGRERNLGFHTAVGKRASTVSESIRVCVDEDQTLSSGDRIRLRLVEPM